MAQRRRKHIPLEVKLNACLILLGFDPFDESDPIQWDHFPALGLRDFDEATGEYSPAELDPRYLQPLQKTKHKAKTNGRKGEKRVTSYGSDVHAIAKQNRVGPAEEEFQRRVLAKEPGKPREKSSRWPTGRKIRSRGFDKREARP